MPVSQPHGRSRAVPLEDFADEFLAERFLSSRSATVEFWAGSCSRDSPGARVATMLASFRFYESRSRRSWSVFCRFFTDHTHVFSHCAKMTKLHGSSWLSAALSAPRNVLSDLRSISLFIGDSRPAASLLFRRWSHYTAASAASCSGSPGFPVVVSIPARCRSTRLFGAGLLPPVCWRLPELYDEMLALWRGLNV